MENALFWLKYYRFLNLIYCHPERTQNQICQLTGMKLSMVYIIIEKLTAKKLIKFEKKGISKRYSVNYKEYWRLSDKYKKIRI